MMCRTLQLLAAVTIVVLGPSAGCAYGGQQQEVGGSKNTGNDQQEQDEDTNGQHQGDCAADRRSQQPFVLSYNNDIWTMSINGSDLAPVTATGEHEGYEIVESEPAWSPDHKRIAFTRLHYAPASGSADPEPLQYIYVMNSDGSCQTKLLDSNASGPTWSPDGKRITFSADLSEEGSNSIYVMNADGSGNPRLLTPSLQTLSPAWSPDGKKIAFEGANQIYVTKACCKLGSTKRLTHGPGWNREPVWSPDGTEVAFTHVDLGKEYWGEVIRNTDVYKMDADGSRETRLTHRFSSKYPEHDAVWSPTGDQIAFIKGYYTGTDSVYSDAIYVMNSHGSDPTLVRKVPEGYEMDIAWQ